MRAQLYAYDARTAMYSGSHYAHLTLSLPSPPLSLSIEAVMRAALPYVFPSHRSSIQRPNSWRQPYAVQGSSHAVRC